MPDLEIYREKTPNAIGTVVLCHGAWHDSSCWDDNFFPYFAENSYNVVSFSYRNHGKSYKSRFNRIKDYVKDLSLVLKDIHDENIYLVGHSMGGHVVLKYLEVQNPKIKKSVLLCPVPLNGVISSTLKILGLHPFRLLKSVFSFSLAPIVSDFEIFKKLFYDKNFNEKNLKKFYNALNVESFWAYLDMLIFDLVNPKNIKTPLLVISAQNDFLFSPKILKKTANMMKANYLNYKDMPHNIFHAKNWEEVALNITQFLKEN